MSNLKRATEKIIVNGIRFVFSNQEDNRTDVVNYGGISPYPEARRTPGVLAVADTVTTVLRILDNELFDSSLKESIFTMKVKGVIIAERTRRAIDFLLNSQILTKDKEIYESQVGGFPPMGDIYTIRTISFSDATADATLALLQSYKKKNGKTCVEKLFRYLGGIDINNVNVSDIKKRVENTETESIACCYNDVIKERIRLAGDWLIQNFDTENGLPTYNIPEKEISLYDDRSFPLILTGMALSIMKDLNVEISDRSKMDMILQIIANKKLKNTINKRGYIPFKFSVKDSCSFFNTSLGLQLLNWIDSYRNENILKNLNEEAQKWYNEWKKQKSYWYYTDFDNIVTQEISPLYPFYNATYFRLPPIISLQLCYETNRSKIEERIGELINIVQRENEYCYYCEDRGGMEKATSATASAIMALSDFLSQNGG